jgi:peroxiredoxin Q/BCP
LSDPSGVVCEKYGVLKEKTTFGKKKKGIVRSTFIIDRNGKIAALWRDVKVKGHVQEVLDALYSD